MKTLILALVGLLALSVPALADAAKSTPAQAQAALNPPPALPDTTDWSAKDAFLHFVLSKAELYSGKVEDAVGKAVDVAGREAPKLVKEYLDWKLWEYGLDVAMWAVCVGLGVWAARFCYRKMLNASGDAKEGWTIGMVASLVVTILGGLVSFIGPEGSRGIFGDLLSFIQILVAPRIYVIEQVLHAIKR